MSKIDEKLRTNKPYLQGKQISIADYIIFGDVLVLKTVFHYDLAKYSHIKAWVLEMEKLESYKTVLSEIESKVEEYSHLKNKQ